MSPVSDVGLVNERTSLAWQRTALALVAAAAILARLTFDRVGWLAAGMLGVAVLLGLWVFAESRWRYRQHLGRRHRSRGRGGRAAFALTVATALIAVVELVAIGRT